MKPYTRIAGFTLIELLAVVAIGLILMGFIVPALGNLQRAANITRAGQMIRDEILVGRQLASSRNENVQFRIYEIDGEWNAIQLVRHSDQTPLGRILTLPDAISVSTNTALSPLLGKMIELPDATPHTARAFLLRPNGAVFPYEREENFLTVTAGSSIDQGTIPDNYATIQIQPDTSTTTLFQP